MKLTRWMLESMIQRLGYRVLRRSEHELPLAGFETTTVPTPLLDRLPDAELETLNAILPWATYVVDGKGRRFGQAYGAKKRAEAERIPDPRILDLHRRLPLSSRSVLEVGCFEGLHTIALAQLAQRVIALDARIEHVVKTQVRCSLFGVRAEVYAVDLEQPLPTEPDLHCDVLHHVGVLYHLTDPVSHLTEMAALTREAILLDTHVASESSANKSYNCAGRDWPYQEFGEGGRAGPFAGMRDHAKWLREVDLLQLLATLGFENQTVIERRDERNGPRVLVLAQRATNA